MGANRYVSEVKFIQHNVEVVFNYLSNFENLSRYLTDDLLAGITEKVPQITVRNFSSDRDSCRFEVGGFGASEIRITERTPYTTIKIENSGGLPVDLKCWIQLLPLDTYQSKMRLTVDAEMNMMIKMMVGNKLEKGVEQLASTLAKLPYQ
jgi:carbon monoxide dehydrogenase subunit G